MGRAVGAVTGSGVSGQHRRLLDGERPIVGRRLAVSVRDAAVVVDVAIDVHRDHRTVDAIAVVVVRGEARVHRLVQVGPELEPEQPRQAQPDGGDAASVARPRHDRRHPTLYVAAGAADRYDAPMKNGIARTTDGMLIEVEFDDQVAERCSSSSQAKAIGVAYDGLQAVLEKIASPFIATYRTLSTNVELAEAEIKLGLAFEAEGGIILVKTKGSANLEVTLKLKPVRPSSP